MPSPQETYPDLFNHLSVTKGSHAFSQVASVANMAKVYAPDLPAMPNLIWTANGAFDSLIYRNKEVSIDMISRFCHALFVKAKFLLEDKLLLGAAVPQHQPNYVDQMSNEGIGYTFFRDPQNSCLTDLEYTNTIGSHIMDKENLRLRFFGENGASISHIQLLNWLHDCGEFVHVLIVLVHLVSGQPGGSTELTSQTIVNTDRSGLRNVFWNYSTITLTTYFHKSRVVNGDKYIARSLPKSLSYIMVIYLTIVRPFESFCIEHLYKDNPDLQAKKLDNYHKYLYVVKGKVVQTKELSRLMARFSLEYMGVCLKINCWRHIAIAIMSKRMDYFTSVFQTDPNTSYDLPAASLKSRLYGNDVVQSDIKHHEQSGHSRRTAVKIYGYSNDDHSYMSKDNLFSYYASSINWQHILNFEISDPERQLILGERPTVPKGQLRPKPKPSASISSTMVDMSALTLQRPNTSQGVSSQVMAHRLLSSTATQDDGAGAVTTIQHLRSLRKFMRDDNANFKSTLQAHAIAAVLARDRDLLCVLGTSSGKSLLFMLASYIEKGKVTLVVVPLVSLLDDMIHRARSHGLNVETWKGKGQTLRIVDLLFVIAEQCGDLDLQQHLNELHSMGSLSRIVVDEVHTVLTMAHWRPAMLDVHVLRRQAVPLLLLSATVPSELEGDLAHCFSSNFTTIRAPSTARPDLVYASVQCTSRTDMYKALFKRLQQKGYLSRRGTCGVIYVQQTNVCSSIKSYITKNLKRNQDVTLLVYHAQMKNEQQRRDNITEFMNAGGSSKPYIIICTIAMGMGIDKPNIKFVYHFGAPDGLVEYSQESGRAARSPGSVYNNSGDCCIFSSDDQFKDMMKYRIRETKGYMKQQKEKEMREVFDYIKSKECKRFALQKHLDPLPFTCLASNKYLRCDFCHEQEHFISYAGVSIKDEVESDYTTTEYTEFSVPSAAVAIQPETIPLDDPEYILTAHPNLLSASKRIQLEQKLPIVGMQDMENYREQFSNLHWRVNLYKKYMQKLQSYVETFKGICAVCAVNSVQPGSHDMLSVSHPSMLCPVRDDVCHVCGASECFQEQRCLMRNEAHRWSDLICFDCCMYRAKRADIVLHKDGASFLPCGSDAKDNVLSVCGLAWRRAQHNQLWKDWLGCLAGGYEKIDTFAKYVKWLFTPDHKMSDLMNCLVLVGQLYNCLQYRIGVFQFQEVSQEVYVDEPFRDWHEEPDYDPELDTVSIFSSSPLDLNNARHLEEVRFAGFGCLADADRNRIGDLENILQNRAQQEHPDVLIRRWTRQVYIELRYGETRAGHAVISSILDYRKAKHIREAAAYLAEISNNELVY